MSKEKFAFDIKVAPVVCLLGFVFMIYAVLRKPKSCRAEE